MKVSCIMGTYNRVVSRPHLLEEAVESFLRQTHEDKELVILNDCVGQELVCDAPGVRVVNHPTRFASLGEKLNFGVSLATGEAICEWDDDDISLPHRLAQAAEELRTCHYFNPGGYWFLNSGRLHADHSIGWCLNCSAFTKEAWSKIGGYPRSTGRDWETIQAFGALGAARHARQMPREWAYIYRWGVSDWHLSGRADMERSWADQVQSVTASGRFVIEPRWQRDYDALVREALA